MQTGLAVKQSGTGNGAVEKKLETAPAANSQALKLALAAEEVESYRYSHDPVSTVEFAGAVLSKIATAAGDSTPFGEAAVTYLLRDLSKLTKNELSGVALYDALKKLDAQLTDGQKLINDVPALLLSAVHRNLDSIVDLVSDTWTALEDHFEMALPSQELTDSCLEIQSIRAQPIDGNYAENREVCTRFETALTGLNAVFDFFQKALDDYRPKLEGDSTEKRDFFTQIESEIQNMRGFVDLNVQNLGKFDERIQTLQAELISYFGTEGVEKRAAFYQLINAAAAESLPESFVNDLRLSAISDRDC